MPLAPIFPFISYLWFFGGNFFKLKQIQFASNTLNSRLTLTKILICLSYETKYKNIPTFIRYIDKVLNESGNIAMYTGKFIIKNVVNLFRSNLSSAEISLLSKGLKFFATANKIDQAKLKGELEAYRRKRTLMWHFRNDERPFSLERFKPKSTFNPRSKDAAIETYLSCLEGSY